MGVVAEADPFAPKVDIERAYEALRKITRGLRPWLPTDPTRGPEVGVEDLREGVVAKPESPFDWLLDYHRIAYRTAFEQRALEVGDRPCAALARVALCEALNLIARDYNEALDDWTNQSTASGTRASLADVRRYAGLYAKSLAEISKNDVALRALLCDALVRAARETSFASAFLSDVALAGDLREAILRADQGGDNPITALGDTTLADILRTSMLRPAADRRKELADLDDSVLAATLRDALRRAEDEQKKPLSALDNLTLAKQVRDAILRMQARMAKRNEWQAALAAEWPHDDVERAFAPEIAAGEVWLERSHFLGSTIERAKAIERLAAKAIEQVSLLSPNKGGRGRALSRMGFHSPQYRLVYDCAWLIGACFGPQGAKRVSSTTDRHGEGRRKPPFEGFVEAMHQYATGQEAIPNSFGKALRGAVAEFKADWACARGQQR